MGSLNKNIQLILEFLKAPFLILHTFPRLMTFLVLSVILRYVRSTRPEVFLGKGVLKICSKFTGEHPCRSAISTKFLCNFIEITLRHGCSPVNLLHIFRTTFLKNTSGRLLLYAGDTPLKSKRELATDLCQQIELTSELKSDL